MNKWSFFGILLIVPMLILLSGCGVRKKSLLNKLSLCMTKNAVKQELGRPDEVSYPGIDNNGNITELWYYNLASLTTSAISFGASVCSLNLLQVANFAAGRVIRNEAKDVVFQKTVCCHRA